MTQTSEKLRCFQEYAKVILSKLDEYDSAIQDQYQDNLVETELRSLVESIRNRAIEVRDATFSEVKVAVMGEFNATKTTLLGSLLGHLGMLPDDDVAATGNVTYLRIVQVKGSQLTQFNFEVEYLELMEVRECLDFMLKQLAKKGLDSQLSRNQLDTLRGFSPEADNVWGNVVSWCQEVLGLNLTPGLKQAIVELKVFVESYIHYGDAVCGTRHSIDRDIAYSGLQLSSNSVDALDGNFDQIPSDKSQLPAFLRATFSLIRRINVEVKVPDKVWDLSSLQGANKLVLLDFPGLGAGKSELRDQFLAVREMRNVQTILLLLDSTRPGSARSNQVFDLLKQKRPDEDIDDFLLVGVGRFDDLPNAEVGIDNLLANNEPLTEQRIFQEMPALQAAIESARDAAKGKDDRIALLSAFVGLEYERKNSGSVVETLPPKTLQKLNNFQNRFANLHEKWKRLSGQLKKNQPQSALDNWLDSFATDGGTAQLRYLLESHVANHGLSQLHKDTEGKVKALEAEQLRLQQKLNSPALKELRAFENPDLQALRQALQKLIGSYQSLKTYLEKNLLELGKGIDSKSNRVSLKEEIESKVASEIFGWSQWRTLLSKAENETIDLENRVKKSRRPKIYEGVFPEKSQIDIVTKSDDFFDTFSESCKKLEAFTNARISQAIKDWLTELSNEVVLLEDSEITINIKQQREEIERCIQDQPDLGKEIAVLRYAAFPSRWEDDIVESLEVDKGLTSIDISLLFPLPREDKTSGEPSLMFDWSPFKRAITQVEENHLITILQLKDVMVSSARHKFVEVVAKTTADANAVMRKDLLGETISILEEIITNRSLLKRLVGEEGNQEDCPDWLTILQDIVNVRCPI